MDPLVNILKILSDLVEISDSKDENWSNFNFCGSVRKNIYNYFFDLLKLLDEYSIEGVVVSIDGVTIDYSEIEDYKNLLENPRKNTVSWRINGSKQLILKKLITAEYTVNFYIDKLFLTKTFLCQPFAIQDKEILNQGIKIFLNDNSNSFGGPKLSITSASNDKTLDSWPYEINLPDDSLIKEQIHLVTNDSFYFYPQLLFLEWGNLDNDLAKAILKNSIITLSSCLINDFYSSCKVVIKGIKNIHIPLFTEKDNCFSIELQDSLLKAVKWVYEEKTETRQKLLADRITLEILPESSFCESLPCCLDEALSQSKEQYGFVILDRRDEYTKEVRELLKDIKKQSELYSMKVRNLLSNLVRDFLAAFFLVGISIVSKIGQTSDNANFELPEILLKIFSFYLLSSFLIQMIVNIRDVSISHKELMEWSKITKDYMPRSEIKLKVTESIMDRKKSFCHFSIFFSVLYILLSIACYKFFDTYRLIKFFF